MVKVAVVVLTGPQTHADMSRVANALEIFKKLKEANDDIQLVFDGAGTKWLSELSEPDHPLHGLFEAAKSKITGVCSCCALAFGAREGVQAAGIPLLEEYDRKLVSQGYQVIAF